MDEGGGEGPVSENPPAPVPYPAVNADPSQYVRERSADGRRDVRYPEPPEALSVTVYDNHAHLEIAAGDEALSLAEHLDLAARVWSAGVVQAGGDKHGRATGRGRG